MFSITVEEVVTMSARKGITLIGKTSGIIKKGDYIVDENSSHKSYKVIGIEMVHYINIEKNLTHNPAIMIEKGDSDSFEFKGKTLVSQ